MPTDKRFFKERERRVEIIDEADVVVAGGGPAGVAAAVNASRNGANTLLIERYGCLGGMATGGLVISLEGFFNRREVAVKGIAEEVWRRLEKLKGARISPYYKRKEVLFDPEAFKWVALEMVEEAEVKIILHAWVTSVICTNGNIKGLILESKSGRQAVQGKLFVDATGDGDVAAWAGAPFEKGILSIGVIARVGNVDYSKYLEFAKLKSAEGKKLNEEIQSRKLFKPAPSWRDDIVWFNNGIIGDALNIRDLTKIEIQTRKRIQETITFYCSRRVPGFENAFVLDTASQIGTRESRRIIGDYTLKLQDIKGEQFEDCIGKGSCWDDREVIYDIPYRCLLPKNVNNLIVAGRCISTTHEVHNIIRLIPPCMVTGEAGLVQQLP